MLVAVGLTTTCVKDLRLSSRAFWFLFHSNQFWASRFLDPRQERAWFPVSSSLESPLLKSVAAGSRDQDGEEVRPALAWRTLYWLTGVERMPEQWQKRRRVWKLARGLKMLFGMQQVSFCFRSTVVPSRSLIGSNLPLTPLTNSPSGNQSRTPAFVSQNDGAMERNKTSSHDFASSSHHHSAAVPTPKDLSRMDFLFFGLDPVKRLAGVRLTGRDGKFVKLGYRICDDDEDLLYEGLGVRYDLSVSTQRICGFIVAADSKGTRALSVVFEDGQFSKMIGDWHAEERCFVTWQTVGSTAAEIMGATLGIMVKIEYRIIKNIEAILTFTQEGHRHLRWPAINLASGTLKPNQGPIKCLACPCIRVSSVMGSGVQCGQGTTPASSLNSHQGTSVKISS